VPPTESSVMVSAKDLARCGTFGREPNAGPGALDTTEPESACDCPIGQRAIPPAYGPPLGIATSGSGYPHRNARWAKGEAIVCAGSEKTQPLRALLYEDPLVVADAVLDGVNQAVGHGPPRLLVEGDRSEVFDPRVQLEVRVAAGGDHRLAPRKQVSAEAHVLVVWLDEQVDEMVAADRDMTDRRPIDDGYPRLELGFGQEPIVELLPGARWVGGFKLTREQLRRVRLREAAVVIVRNCIGVSGGRRANLERIHVSILTRRRRAALSSCAQISGCRHSETPARRTARTGATLRP
jgi:hypothetical protein